MSRKYRIGNNLEIQWTVNLHNSDGTLVDLTSLNLGVQLIVGQKIFEVHEPTIAANLITFLFPGSEQKYDGPYVVKLYDKDNTTVTYDVRNAFILVDHSWGADSVYTPDDVTVEIETDINAVQIIAIAGPKGDKGDKGDTGSKGDTGENGADGANGYDGEDGKDGADGKDGQDGRNGVDGKDGEPGRSIRKSVFEVDKMYYNGKVLSDDGVYYLDIVTDTAVAMADEEVNYYVCKDTHLSTANEDLEDTTLWTPMSEMDPIVTPLVLAEQIKAEFIDVDSLIAKKLQVKDANENTLLYAGNPSYPLLCGSTIPSNATTKIDSDGKLYATGGEIGGFKITNNSLGISIDDETQLVDYSGSFIESGVLQVYSRTGMYDNFASFKVTCPKNTSIANKTFIEINAADTLNDSTFTALSVKAGSGGESNGIAIKIPAGRVFGLRPKVRVVNQASITLDDYDYNVIYNYTGSSPEITFVSSPQLGQTYLIWNCSGQSITLNGNNQNIRPCYSGGGSASSTLQLSASSTALVVYDGTVWNVTKIA